jgi:hypothetical protein
MNNQFTAHEAAIDLIKAYVIRGDSLESLRSGQQGSYSDDYHAEIGGCINGKHYGPDKIIVSNLNGKELDTPSIFSLEKIFYTILGKQQNLFN